MDFAFEQDPEFAKLSYASQQRLRLKAASQVFSKDQQFLNLAPDSKLRILQKVALKAPVFEDPQIADEFKKVASNPVLFQTVANANKQVGLLGIIYGMMGKVNPTLAVTSEMLHGADAEKGSAWIQNIIDGNNSLSPIMKVLPKIGSIAGFIADLASYAAGTHTLPTTVIGGMAKEVGARATNQFARWGLSDLLPHLAKMGGMGVTGIARENLMAALNGQAADNSIGNLARTFGSYAAGDTLAWNAIALAGPFLKLSGTVLKSFGRSSSKLTESLYKIENGKKVPLSSEDIAAYEQSLARGNLSDFQIQMLSPAVQDHLISLRSRQMYADNPELAARDPYGKTVLAAGSIGLDVTKLASGGFRVRHMADPGTFVDVPTLGQLDSSLVEYMRQRKELFNLDELRADPLRGHLVAIMDAQDGIDAAMKGFKPGNAADSYIPLTSRSRISPLEAEAAKAASFSGAGQSAVTDTFSIPLSEASLKKAASSEGLFPKGVDAVVVQKEEKPNVFVSAGKVAPQGEFVAAQAWAKRAQDAGSKASESELIATALRRAGYDGAYTLDGNFLVLYPDRQVKVLNNGISPKTGKVGFRTPVRMRQENASVSLIGAKVAVPDLQISKDGKLLSALLKTDAGIYNQDYASRGASLLLKRLGAKDTRVQVRPLEGATEIQIRKGKAGLQIFTPPKMEDFPAKLAKVLANHVAEEGRASKPKAIGNVDVRVPQDARTQANLKTWFANFIETNPIVKGWAQKNAQGLSPTETIQKLAKSELSSASLKGQMFALGVRIVGGEGSLKAVKGGKIIASGKTADELVSALGVDLKVPSSFAPKIVGLSPDGAVFEVAGIGVRGGPKDIWKMLDSFENYAREATKKKVFSNGEGELAFVSPGSYEVTMPRYGARARFSSIEEARAFIQGEWARWGNLSDRIEASGGVLRYENGEYVAWVGGTKKTAKTLPELASVLRDLPEPSAIPDLVGEDAHLYYKEGAPLLDFQQFRPMYTDLPPEHLEANFLGKIGILIKPFGTWITDYARKVGAIEVLRRYEDIETAIRTASRDSDLAIEVLSQMEMSMGKWRPGRVGRELRERRQGIFHLLGEPDAMKQQAIIETFHLNEGDIGISQRLRKMLGTSPNDPEGYFAKFGMDRWKFIYSYMSRIRAATDESSILHLNQPESTEQILAKAFSRDGVPNEIKFWAENMRQSDIISFALDTDIFSVMRRYITRGNLRLYAGESWRNMVSLLNQEGVDKALRWRVFRYLDQLQGGGFTDREKMMQHFFASFQKALGKSDAEIAQGFSKDFMRTLYSLTYTTHLGWRPFVAIRNLMQMYQTVGPLVGNSYLEKAAAFVSSKVGKEYILALRRRGVIHQAPPIVNQLADSEHILHGLQDSSLSMFKVADDLTRAVGYRAGELRYADGLTAFKTVTLDNAKQFAEYIGSNLYGPEMNSRILEAAMAGKHEIASHLLGNALQERALFLIRREQSPVAFQGVVGKMFGQYGTFAANYVQFVSQTWKYATKVQKAAFAARWIGNSAALAAGMYALGMQGKDWLPWAPAQFTGGPLFNLSVDLIHSIGSDYQARQARGEVNRMLPVDLNKLLRGEGLEFQPPVGMPGYYQIRTILKMKEYAEAGDPWKCFLALLSAPVRSE